jgi:hypothetical protein
LFNTIKDPLNVGHKPLACRSGIYSHTQLRDFKACAHTPHYADPKVFFRVNCHLVPDWFVRPEKLGINIFVSTRIADS